MWEGAEGDDRYGPGYGDLLEIAWTVNEGWWAATQHTAPVTGLPLDPQLGDALVRRARQPLAEGVPPDEPAQTP